MAITDKLTAIADAIRANTGETGKMTLVQRRRTNHTVRHIGHQRNSLGEIRQGDRPVAVQGFLYV